MNSTSSVRLLLVAILAICVLPAPLIAKSVPVWSASMEEDIEWFKLTEMGNLVVATKSEICGINPEEGKKDWSMTDLGSLREGDVELIPYSPYALVSPRKIKWEQSGSALEGPRKIRWEPGSALFMINVQNGEKVWDAEDLGLGETYGHLFYHPLNALLIYGKMAAEPDDKVVMALNVETGDLLWEQRDFFGDKDPPLYRSGDPEEGKKILLGHQRPLFDSDNTMILYMTKTGLRKYNLSTGELIWAAPGEAGNPPALREGYSPMLLSEDAGVVYAPYKKKLGAFNTNDGSRLWNKDPKFKGIVRQLQLTPNGLIVRRGPNMENNGNHEISMLDPATGATIWGMPFGKIKDGSNFILSEGQIVMAANMKLYSMDVATGEHAILAEFAKFEGNEKPQTLELREGGYFLSSSQNAMLIDFEGNTSYHSYHEAPGTSFLAALGKEMLVGMVNSAAYGSVGSSGDFTFSAGIQMDYPDLSERFKASSESNSCVYQLTDFKFGEEQGPGLVKLVKDQGDVEKRIVLGTKSPMYEIDAYSNKLFFRSGKRVIVCYDF